MPPERSVCIVAGLGMSPCDPHAGQACCSVDPLKTPLTDTPYNLCLLSLCAGLITSARSLPASVSQQIRNFGGATWNHALYFLVSEGGGPVHREELGIRMGGACMRRGGFPYSENLKRSMVLQ
jgi:hypothetical protein